MISKDMQCQYSGPFAQTEVTAVTYFLCVFAGIFSLYASIFTNTHSLLFPSFYSLLKNRNGSLFYVIFLCLACFTNNTSLK